MTPEREAGVPDLVERLNSHRSSDYMCQDCYGNVMDEAAEEIARLRSSLAKAERERDEARAAHETTAADLHRHMHAVSDSIDRATSLEALLTEARENQAASQRMTASAERSLARSIALHESAEALLDEAVKAVKELADAAEIDMKNNQADDEDHPDGGWWSLRTEKAIADARSLLTRIEAREGGEEEAT